MKQYIFNIAVIIVAGTLGVACAKLSIYESEYKTPFAKVAAEHMNSESNLMYTVEHDDENLYLKISTSDITTQGSILMKGLTIWADQKVKKNEIVGFTYPIAVKSQIDPTESQRTERQDRSKLEDTSSQSQKMFEYYEKSPKQMKLIGFESPGSIQLVNPSNESAPVDVSILMSETGRMTYRASVPLQFIFYDADVSKDQMSIGITIAAQNMPLGRPSGQDANAGGGGRGQGGHTGGGNRGGGGGGGGGRPTGGAPGGGMSSPSATEFWFQVNLNEASK